MSDNIDYEHTMNVAGAHAAVAREKEDQPVRNAPLGNLPLILSAIILLVGGSYVGGNLKGAYAKERPLDASAAPELPPDVKWLKDGEAAYTTTCGGCHQGNGVGNPGSGYPPLAGSEFVTGGEKRLCAIVLKGLAGPIHVKGQAFGSAVMNAKGGQNLTDKQVAQIVSYIRNSWGNKGTFVMDDQIKALNAEISGLASPLPTSELDKIKADENLPPSKKPLAPGGAPAPVK
ncbi:MAG: cytochrome c [Verrucomicrobiales bacterium]|nr:cytochrome c [Verrucomicrobiales bacterium]